MAAQRPDYGIDAPGVRRGMAAAGLGGAVLAGVSAAGAAVTAGAVSSAASVVAGAALLMMAYGFGMAGFMTYTSRVGKLRARDRMLATVGRLRPWAAVRDVLDVGCGRGLMLIGAARRLTDGTAIGVDLWRDEDQAGNTAAATLENARREGVAHRVAIETADARALPFADASFDVVLSHWVVHNLPDAADRARALDEMVRVLRPGGVIALANIAHIDDYRARFEARGLGDVQGDTGGPATRIWAS